LTFYQGKGCDDCSFTGYKGRTLLSEVFVVDKEISRALNKGAELDELKSLALERGMKNMLDDGLLKLRDTTLTELVKMIPHDMIQEFRTRGRSQNVKAPTIENRAEDQRYSVNQRSMNSGFLVSNPENEEPLIDRMHKRYRILASQTDGKNTPVDRSIFRDFVNESFHEICRRFQTKQVSFAIEKNDGKVEILAIPYQ
jgi:hypothetical protein